MRRTLLLTLALLVGCAPDVDSVTTELPPETTTTTATIVPPTTPALLADADDGMPSKAEILRAVLDEWPEMLAACESTWDTDAREPHVIDPAAVSKTGRYRGAFQWALSTWRMADGPNIARYVGVSPHLVHDPALVPYGVERLVAVWWQAKTNPYRQWPTCWPKLFGFDFHG